MSDKEPRRRKKRKDQLKKDDVQFEETSYVPQKQESKDSDQETEDDHYVATQHQPSKIAKVIFMLLFSTLVVTMSIVFIALRGAERGPVDIFDMDHHEAAVEIEGNHEEDMEVWNISEQESDQHYEETHIKDSIETLDVTEPPDHEEELLSNVYYKNEEVTDDLSNLEAVSGAYEEQFEATHSWHEDIVDEDIDEDVENSVVDAFTPATSEGEVGESNGETVVEAATADQFQSVYEKLGSVDEGEEVVLETAFPVTEQQADAHEAEEEYDAGDDVSHLGGADTRDTNAQDDDDTHEADTMSPTYEKLDITHGEDYNIKEELDDIDSILDKDDDDDDAFEAEEEFDFWHF